MMKLQKRLSKKAWEMNAVQWLEQIRKTRKYSTYVKYLNIYQTILKPAWNYKKTDIPEWNHIIFENEKISDSYKCSIYTVLRGILRQAEKNGYKTAALTPKYTKKKKKRVEIMTVEEQSKLLNYLYMDMDTYKMGIILCLTTGLRLGEICSLRQSDINFDFGILYVTHTVQRISTKNNIPKTILLESKPKTESSVRKIPLSDELLKLLYRYGQKSEYIIGGNKPMEPRTYQNKFKKYLLEAGVITYKRFLNQLRNEQRLVTAA